MRYVLDLDFSSLRIGKPMDAFKVYNCFQYSPPHFIMFYTTIFFLCKIVYIYFAPSIIVYKIVNRLERISSFPLPPNSTKLHYLIPNSIIIRQVNNEYNFSEIFEIFIIFLMRIRIPIIYFFLVSSWERRKKIK